MCYAFVIMSVVRFLDTAKLLKFDLNWSIRAVAACSQRCATSSQQTVSLVQRGDDSSRPAARADS
jgi:hypothetical protein